MTLDAAMFRRVLGGFASGVTVVTTRTGADQPVGLTVSSFASLSLAPPLVSFNVALSSNRHDPLVAAPAFCVNILAADQAEVSNRFARVGGEDPFANTPWHAGPEGQPVLEGALGWLVCRRWACYAGGDHSILVGEVVALDTTEQAPLLYFRGRYGAFVPAS
ncbi:MAG: flavin reductase [Alphaproteobacteria bacterium]|nr:flavin reductase family protein [Alphaproteobacteria bacterium]TAD90343.1 MAG: flavin reductase [Alphaproteobacteria bacterium]